MDGGEVDETTGSGVTNDPPPGADAPGVAPRLPHSPFPRILLAVVVLGAIARLYNIDVPLFDFHSYRQHDTAALARNFYEGQMNILYPQVDWRGESPGYVEVPLQLYTYPVALLYHVFGPHEWVGRAFNILVYVFSALLLFRLTARVFDRRAGILATGIYTAVPLAFYQTRAFQPDALLALGSLAGVYYFWVWTEQPRWRFLALSALGTAVAVLIKPPSLYLAVPLAFLAYRRFGLGALRRPALWGYAAFVIVPAFLWFRHAYGLWVDYGNTFGLLGRQTVAGIWPLGDYHWVLLAKKLAERITFEILTPPGFLLLGAGFAFNWWNRSRVRSGVLWWWLIGFGVYVLLVPRGHWGHNHYQLPAVFLAAAWMGYGAARLIEKGTSWRIGTAALIAALIAASAWRLGSMLSVDPERYSRIAFGQRVQELTEPDALLVFIARRPVDHPPEIYRHRTPDGEFLYCDPIDFYLSRRKGWNPDDFQATPELLEKVRGRGARYVATFFPQIFERQPELKAWLDSAYTPLEATEEWAIYRMDEPAEPPPGDAPEVPAAASSSPSRGGVGSILPPDPFSGPSVSRSPYTETAARRGEAGRTLQPFEVNGVELSSPESGGVHAACACAPPSSWRRPVPPPPGGRAAAGRDARSTTNHAAQERAL